MVLSNTSLIMKLIFLLFINLFYKFAVYGDGEHQPETIETRELKENDRMVVNLAQDKQERQLIKRTLWESDQKLLKINQKILESDQKLLKINQKILEIEQKWNESFSLEVFCAISTIKVVLEKGYHEASHSLVKSNEENYETLCYDTFQPKYLDILIKQDQKWIQTFDKESRNKKNYYRDIQNYKQTWIKYLFSEEGHRLALLIAPKTLDNEIRNDIFIRFSYNMARLYKIVRACGYKLMMALSQRYEEKPQSFINNLKDVVPLWSCTGEQIKFFNKLYKYIYPNTFKNLKALIFEEAKITQTRNVTFVIPHTRTRHACGDEVTLDLDTL